MSSDVLEIIRRLKKVWTKLVADPERWSYQAFTEEKGLEYWAQKQPIKESDFLSHFSQKPRRIPGGVMSGVSLAAKTKDDRVKWIAFDCDSSHCWLFFLTKTAPRLLSLDIDYILDHSGTDEEARGRLFIFCDLSLLDAKRFVSWLLSQDGIDPYDKNLSLEVFPTKEENKFLRIPGSFHLKTNRVNPIEFKSKKWTSPIKILDAFLEARILTEERVLELIGKYEPNKRKPKKKSMARFMPQGLPLPDAGIPPRLQKCYTNCRAMSHVAFGAKEERLVDRRGGLHHDAGLYLFGSSLWHDMNFSRRGKPVHTGQKWIKGFLKNYRERPWESHKWDIGEFDRLFPTCKAWNNAFNACDGCPVKGRIHSPKQFMFSRQVKSFLKRKKKLRTVEEIRETTFKQVQARIKDLIKKGERSDILLASPQGSGKTRGLIETAASLASEGKRTLIAVPTADIAIEIRKELRSRGVAAFVMFSHRNTFKHIKEFKTFGQEIECPYYEPIQHLETLGVSSRIFKQNYCEPCDVREECPFISQYQAVREENYPVVIIQHAHFKSEEAMFAIFEQKFDLLAVDEAFIDNIIDHIWPTTFELQVLKDQERSIEWVPDLLTWLKDGGVPGNKIRASVDELEALKEYFDEQEAPWNIPSYLRAYNAGHDFDPGSGLYVFSPIPFVVPVRIFTDATPPVELLQLILNTHKIETYGQDEVLDYRKINPDNRVIQTLDGSASKTYLRGEFIDGEWSYEPLIEILEYIGDEARHKYQDKRILVTTYVEMEDLAREWLSNNYSDVMDRIEINHMAIGTNKFSSFHVQYVIAAVNFNAAMFHDYVYKIFSVINHWREKDGKEHIQIAKKFDIGDQATIPRVKVPLTRIHPYKDEAFLCEYDGFDIAVPEEDLYRWIYEFLIAKTQQAGRIRFTGTAEESENLDPDGEKSIPEARTIIFWDRKPMPSFLITDSALTDDLLSNIRNAENLYDS